MKAALLLAAAAVAAVSARRSAQKVLRAESDLYVDVRDPFDEYEQFPSRILKGGTNQDERVIAIAGDKILRLKPNFGFQITHLGKVVTRGFFNGSTGAQMFDSIVINPGHAAASTVHEPAGKSVKDKALFALKHHSRPPAKYTLFYRDGPSDFEPSKQTEITMDAYDYDHVARAFCQVNYRHPAIDLGKVHPGGSAEKGGKKKGKAKGENKQADKGKDKGKGKGAGAASGAGNSAKAAAGKGKAPHAEPAHVASHGGNTPAAPPSSSAAAASAGGALASAAGAGAGHKYAQVSTEMLPASQAAVASASASGADLSSTVDAQLAEVRALLRRTGVATGAATFASASDTDGDGRVPAEVVSSFLETSAASASASGSGSTSRNGRALRRSAVAGSTSASTVSSLDLVQAADAAVWEAEEVEADAADSEYASLEDWVPADADNDAEEVEEEQQEVEAEGEGEEGWDDSSAHDFAFAQADADADADAESEAEAESDAESEAEAEQELDTGISEATARLEAAQLAVRRAALSAGLRLDTGTASGSTPDTTGTGAHASAPGSDKHHQQQHASGHGHSVAAGHKATGTHAAHAAAGAGAAGGKDASHSGGNSATGKGKGKGKGGKGGDCGNAKPSSGGKGTGKPAATSTGSKPKSSSKSDTNSKSTSKGHGKEKGKGKGKGGGLVLPSRGASWQETEDWGPSHCSDLQSIEQVIAGIWAQEQANHAGGCSGSAADAGGVLIEDRGHKLCKMLRNHPSTYVRDHYASTGTDTGKGAADRRKGARGDTMAVVDARTAGKTGTGGVWYGLDLPWHIRLQYNTSTSDAHATVPSASAAAAATGAAASGAAGGGNADASKIKIPKFKEPTGNGSAPVDPDPHVALLPARMHAGDVRRAHRVFTSLAFTCFERTDVEWQPSLVDSLAERGAATGKSKVKGRKGKGKGKGKGAAAKRAVQLTYIALETHTGDATRSLGLAARAMGLSAEVDAFLHAHNDKEAAQGRRQPAGSKDQFKALLPKTFAALQALDATAFSEAAMERKHHWQLHSMLEAAAHVHPSSAPAPAHTTGAAGGASGASHHKKGAHAGTQKNKKDSHAGTHKKGAHAASGSHPHTGTGSSSHVPAQAAAAAASNSSLTGLAAVYDAIAQDMGVRNHADLHTFIAQREQGFVLRSGTEMLASARAVDDLLDAASDFAVSDKGAERGSLPVVAAAQSQCPTRMAGATGNGPDAFVMPLDAGPKVRRRSAAPPAAPAAASATGSGALLAGSAAKGSSSAAAAGKKVPRKQ